MDVALLFFLIVLNAAFAMSEMALTASRKARLQVMLEAGERGAEAAIDLHDHPTKFLSTVQVGITSISVLNGIVGDAAFSEPLGEWLHATFGLSVRPAHVTATALVVLIITVLTIIFGELVPKRIGQMFPETVASLLAPPMQMLSVATRPLVVLLSKTTEAILRLLGIRGNANRAVTEEEIAASLEEGLDAGVIEAQEHQMVRNVFRLDDRQIGSMMIPRAEIQLARRQRADRGRAQGRRRGRPHARYPGLPRRARRRHRRHHRAGPAQAAGRRPHAGAHRGTAAAGLRARDAVRHGAAGSFPHRTWRSWCSWSTSTARCRA